MSDGEISDAASVSLVVNAVNDAPVLASVSDVSFDEDGSGSTSISASDVDGDDLDFSISGGTDITATLDGSSVSFSAPVNYNGSENFTVAVTDGELSDSQIITVTVNAVNDAPVATTGLSGTGDEDQSISVLLSGSDVDGDVLTYTITSSPINGSVEISGSNATYTPDANFNGSDSFTFSVSDGTLTDSASVTVSVNAVNDAPVLASVSDVSFDEDGSGSTSISASDVDGDNLSYSISEGTDITATLDGNSISFSAPENFNGSESFIVTVSDGDLSSSQSFTVTVSYTHLTLPTKA